VATDIRALVTGGDRFSCRRFDRIGRLLEETVTSIGVDAGLTTDRDALTDLDG